MCRTLFKKETTQYNKLRDRFRLVPAFRMLPEEPSRLLVQTHMRRCQQSAQKHRHNRYQAKLLLLLLCFHFRSPLSFLIILKWRTLSQNV